MRKRYSFGLVLGAGLAGFMAYPPNQRALVTMLANTAAGRPSMQGVAFKVPFWPETKKVEEVPVYPAGVYYGDDVGLPFYQLGDGYRQTAPFSLVDGRATKEVEDWRAHFRFKLNPPDDPFHPGCWAVATNGDRHKLWFQPAGASDLDEVTRVPHKGWHGVHGAEQAAAGPLHVGDVLLLRIKTIEPVEVVKPETPSASASVRTYLSKKVTYAKLAIKRLSRSEVRFDFVYLADGRKAFPLPQRPTPNRGTT